MTCARRGNSSGRWNAGALAVALMLLFGGAAHAQGLGGAGTVQGTVKDPTGGVMVAVTVSLSNPVSGFKREAVTDDMGHFIFRNLPPNPYHLEVAAQGFQTLQRDVDVRTAVPIELDLSLVVANTASVEVVGHATDLLERDPTAHTDVDQSLVDRLPVVPSVGLNSVVTLAAPGVVADANGFFHPIGDHAQTQFSIDNQPVTDQQSKLYSNQISTDAVQSMEIITGVPPAEFGDKSSLIVQIVTKSGLGQRKPTGSVDLGYGSFREPTGDFNFGVGSNTFGNFFSASGLRSDRVLDTPEFSAMHGSGDNGSLFDRVDVHPSPNDTLHLNVQAARSSFDVPNTYDQSAAGQDQHQTISTVNIAPGYTRVLSARALLAANGYVRRDHVIYSPSPDPLADESGTVSQDRTLTNVGAKVDLSYTRGAHNVKAGGSYSSTRLNEQFSLGLTDPTDNSPCVDNLDDLSPSDDTALTSPSQCGALGLIANPGFLPKLLAFDLTRGGGLYQFNGGATIKESSAYIQDEITAGPASIKLGLRADHYDGLTNKSLLQPRAGLSFAVPGSSGTVLRASYGRTMETPYNENLVLSSTADPSIFGTNGQPLAPGIRDQMETGIQQAFGRWFVVDVGYFYKHTKNAYDFGEIFSTPIFFPVEWDHSDISGFTGRVNLVEHAGFMAYTVIGSTKALFFPPGTGGLLLDQPGGEFRIDHDQKFEQTTNVQYTFVKKIGAWGALSWRYDSGLVAGAATDQATVLSGLTGDQQAQIGLTCAGVAATVDAPIRSCAPADFHTSRVTVPLTGEEDDVNNPPRIAPRHLFDLGLGIDNLLRTEKTKLRVHFTVLNLTNKEALYNFLSTFSGTHFVAPRTYQVQVGLTF